MLILNPLYDTAFKYLMDNEAVAKIVLSTILGVEVVALSPMPQETPFRMQGWSLSRFDYRAVIRDPEGEEQMVIVEVQKSRSPSPIPRFRNYLALNYASGFREAIAFDSTKALKHPVLPVVPIYILGYDLAEFEGRIIRVDTLPYDYSLGRHVEVKSRFVELLTHRCHILIAVDKEEKQAKQRRGRKGASPADATHAKAYHQLELLLDLFIQKIAGADKNDVVEIEGDRYEDGGLKSVVDHLHLGTLDDELIRSIFLERTYEDYGKTLLEDLATTERNLEVVERSLEATERNLEATERNLEATERNLEATERNLEATERKREIAERNLEAAEQKRETAERNLEATERNLEAAEQKRETAERQRVDLARKMAGMMLAMGRPLDEIARETGLSKDEIEGLT
ncbi:MAG: hypothetical protein CSA07_01280 [Bacteroidia bacterium]|nr:MAG: hypothetical protein CSA07_01280 [Bacteroidia bacterium]